MAQEKTALALRREALGLSQIELAAALHVSQAAISRNETAAEPDKRYELALEALELRKQIAASSERANEARAA